MNKIWMTRASKILRWIALSFLFGGSTAIVFAAITLVEAAKAQGVPVAQAAAVNAPVFIHYSTVALFSAFALLLSESMDYAVHRRLSRLVIARYAASLASSAAIMIFAFGIVPEMKELLPVLNTAANAHAEFAKYHQISRMVFGTAILLAFVSLIIPAFEKPAPADLD